MRSSMHPYPGNRVAIGRAVVYYAWFACKCSAGIKCQHCKNIYVRRDYVLYMMYSKQQASWQTVFLFLKLFYSFFNMPISAVTESICRKQSIDIIYEIDWIVKTECMASWPTCSIMHSAHASYDLAGPRSGVQKAICIEDKRTASPGYCILN